ncbi:SpoIIE family protein phosphatase [Streptomyces sp. R33]|uniref:SpoIIE family protein phosphatase n=1 Tax=Streptomyces sp. R33 TaxID=3238629 RepID=A0AB39YF23_9ACTN
MYPRAARAGELGRTFTYTDGLVETSVSDTEGQVDGLAAVLGMGLATTGALDGAADRLLSDLLPDVDDNPDDVTLLLVRIPEVPGTSRTVVLGADASRAHVAPAGLIRRNSRNSPRCMPRT